MLCQIPLLTIFKVYYKKWQINDDNNNYHDDDNNNNNNSDRFGQNLKCLKS